MALISTQNGHKLYAMSTLTQVWVFSLSLCAVVLITGFKLADRLGLLLAFSLSLILLYLILHKGLKLFLDQIKARPQVGSDPTGFSALLKKNSRAYQIPHVVLHYTEESTHPLVWSDFNHAVHMVLNRDFVMALNDEEKKILAHLTLSHGHTQSRLPRRFLSILFLALTPISSVLIPVFNIGARLFGFNKQFYTADMRAAQNAQAHLNEFCLFLRKIHNSRFHKTNYSRGENFFSLLSAKSRSLLSLKLSPSLENRTKHIIGYTT